MLEDPLITAVLNNVAVEPKNKGLVEESGGNSYRIAVQPGCTAEAVVPVSSADDPFGELQRLNRKQKPRVSLALAYVGSRVCGKHAIHHSNSMLLN